MQSGDLQELIGVGRTLESEKYEHIAAVQERETSLRTGFTNLDQAGEEKKPIFEDHLQREVCLRSIDPGPLCAVCHSHEPHALAFHAFWSCPRSP